MGELAIVSDNRSLRFAYSRVKSEKKVFPQAIFVEQNNASNKLTAKKNTYMYYERGVK